MNPQEQYPHQDNPSAGGLPRTYAPQNSQTTPQPNQVGGYDVVPPLTPTPGDHGHNPYEFIFSQAPKQKKRLFGASLLARVLMIVGVLGVLTILAVIAISLLAPNDKANERLLATAQEQQEIIRVAKLGSTKASSGEIRNFALNTQFSLISSQKAAITYLDERGTKTDEKMLALKLNSDTDKTLAEALSSGAYDSTLTKILRNQLVTYRTNLSSAYQEVTGENARKVLKDSDATAALLVKQADQLIPAETAN